MSPWVRLCVEYSQTWWPRHLNKETEVQSRNGFYILYHHACSVSLKMFWKVEETHVPLHSDQEIKSYESRWWLFPSSFTSPSSPRGKHFLNGFCVIHLNFLILLAHVCIPTNREYHFVFNVLELCVSELHNLIFFSLLPIPPLMMIPKGISSHFHCRVDFHYPVYNLFKHFVHWWGCFRFLTRIMQLQWASSPDLSQKPSLWVTGVQASFLDIVKLSSREVVPIPLYQQCIRVVCAVQYLHQHFLPSSPSLFASLTSTKRHFLWFCFAFPWLSEAESLLVLDINVSPFLELPVYVFGSVYYCPFWKSTCRSLVIMFHMSSFDKQKLCSLIKCIVFLIACAFWIFKKSFPTKKFLRLSF